MTDKSLIGSGRSVGLKSMFVRGIVIENQVHVAPGRVRRLTHLRGYRANIVHATSKGLRHNAPTYTLLGPHERQSSAPLALRCFSYSGRQPSKHAARSLESVS